MDSTGDILNNGVAVIIPLRVLAVQSWPVGAVPSRRETMVWSPRFSDLRDLRCAAILLYKVNYYLHVNRSIIRLWYHLLMWG